MDSLGKMSEAAILDSLLRTFPCETFRNQIKGIFRRKEVASYHVFSFFGVSALQSFRVECPRQLSAGALSAASPETPNKDP